MFRPIFVILILSIRRSSGIIYKMNESEYAKMPSLYHLDPYDSCLAEPGGIYCVLDMNLFSETDSELMRIIQGYSAHKMKHFNHTVIHRGVCVMNTCKQFIGNKSINTELDLKRTLEACLNESLWKNYKLQGKLADLKYCNKEGDKINVDASDMVVAVVYVVLIMLNLAGSLYDILVLKEDKSGNPYLLAFSVKRNWARLVAPIDAKKEPRLERLKLFHGLRTMTMICVFFSHTALIMAFGYIENPLFIEKSYEDPTKQILYNGTLVTHTFFVMSSFLMAYNMSLHAEQHHIVWWHWPKGLLMRWLRLTPTYALVLATICTWMRYAGSGPLWDYVVTSESTACRQYWWAHVLYLNNYIYEDAFCAPQTWYLAADTQLFCIGLLVCVMIRSARRRVLALTTMLVAALAIVAAHTYIQDLDAVVIQAPEAYRNLYAHEDTLRLIYIRGHTNLSTYTLGLAGGFLAYYLQTEKKELKGFKKHRWAFWLLFPVAVGVILSGGLFYVDGERPSVALRVLYATFYKPVFQLLVVAFIMGCIFKFETLYRGIVEWRGFTWTGRVSYSAFLLHTLFQRGLVGSYPGTIYMTDYFVLMVLCATIFMTYVGAAVLWLLVEAPVAGVIRAVQGSGRGEGADAHGGNRGDGENERSKV